MLFQWKIAYFHWKWWSRCV